jgi:hypothetical protein
MGSGRGGVDRTGLDCGEMGKSLEDNRGEVRRTLG